MDKRNMIEKVIKVLIDKKDCEKYWMRNYLHRYEDEKADGREEFHLNYLKKSADEKAKAVKELEMLIDFMQGLHYEEVK